MLGGLFPDEHETQSELRIKAFQTEVNERGRDSSALEDINSRLDAQLKIEDFIVKSREANHAWWKVHGPTLISLAVAVAVFATGVQSLRGHALEERKVNAEIVRNAVRANPEETIKNLKALKAASLLDMKAEDIEKLRYLTPPSTASTPLPPPK